MVQRLPISVPARHLVRVGFSAACLGFMVARSHANGLMGEKLADLLQRLLRRSNTVGLRSSSRHDYPLWPRGRHCGVLM